MRYLSRQHLSQICQWTNEKPQKSFHGLCLAFDFKGHKTNCQQWPMSYLHAKSEPNWARNGFDTFNGQWSLCLAFNFEGHYKTSLPFDLIYPSPYHCNNCVQEWTGLYRALLYYDDSSQCTAKANLEKGS